MKMSPRKIAIFALCISGCTGPSPGEVAGTKEVDRFQWQAVPQPTQNRARAVGQAVVRDFRSNSTYRLPLQFSDEVESLEYTQPPGNAVGIPVAIQPHDARIAVLLFTAPAGPKRCVGAVISRRLILTAGHCVFQSGTFVSTMEVVPGYQTGSEPRYRAARLVAFNGWVDSAAQAHDIGLVELSSDLPTSIVPYHFAGFYPQCPVSPVIPHQKRYYDPQLNAGTRQYRLDGQYIGCDYGRLVHLLPTSQGSSGSPSFSARNPNEIIAVVSARGNQFGYDARLTKGKFCFIAKQLMGGVCI